jgi:hypothetical protein
VPSPRSPGATSRAPEITDEDIEAAKSYEERSLFCLRVLTLGQWAATEKRLLRIWQVGAPGLANYRRAGKVALHAIGSDDAPKRLEQTLADLRHLAERHEELAEFYRSRNRPTLALHHDGERRRAVADFASVAGLTERRVTISLETDPRLAGLWPVLHAALEDVDRMLDAYRGEVEKMTHGALPSAPLPKVQAHVLDAVRRYEAEIGARKLADRPFQSGSRWLPSASNTSRSAMPWRRAAARTASAASSTRSGSGPAVR